MSDDHTHGLDRVVADEISIEEARDDADWHVISNWLGFEFYRVAAYRVPAVPGDRMLLCTGGLANMLTDDDIAELLIVGTPPDVTQALIDAANEAGGTDNITVAVSEVLEA